MKAMIAIIPEMNINIMLDSISSLNQEDISRMSSLLLDDELL
jgi:hypothetical protein